MRDHATGSNTIIETHPALIIWIFTPAQEVLVTHVVGTLIDHPVSTLDLDGVAATEVGMQVSAIIAALIRAPLEILVLKECYLERVNLFSSTVE